MRVRVDPTKCKAHGNCHELCPSVFELDDWGHASIVDPKGAVDPLNEVAVGEAIDSCPEQAIVEV